MHVFVLGVLLLTSRYLSIGDQDLLLHTQRDTYSNQRLTKSLTKVPVTKISYVVFIERITSKHIISEKTVKEERSKIKIHIYFKESVFGLQKKEERRPRVP